MVGRVRGDWRELVTTGCSGVTKVGGQGMDSHNTTMGQIVEKPRGDLEKVLPREDLKPRDVPKAGKTRVSALSSPGRPK